MVSDAYLDPIYNLKAVVEQTGVTADALRAWERRYGLPDPARTEAGHRIYARKDIDVIRWLVARQEEGLRIGRAVKLWESLKDEGQNPLRSMPIPGDHPFPRRPPGETVAEFREAWVEACMAFDEQGAQRVLTEALALYPPALVFSSVVGAGMSEVGHRWYTGEATVQQEHFASDLAMRRLKALIEAAPAPTRRGVILTVCPPGEQHTLGMTTYILLLRRAGWNVVHLGANVPVEAFEPTIEVVRPDLIVAAAQRLVTAASLLDVAELARDFGVVLAYGGRIFNEHPPLRQRIPGHFLGETLEQAARETDRLMTTARQLPEVYRTSDAAKAARDHFLDLLPTLKADVAQTLASEHVDGQVFRHLNRDALDAVSAALRFDDMDLFGRYLDWIEGQGELGVVSDHLLTAYLRALTKAGAKHLDQRGALVVDWLGQYLKRKRQAGA